ncbi:hypothetical protein Hdeb2414_s0022g00617981 [Helianthus debilis subsp. tardiflorus]
MRSLWIPIEFWNGFLRPSMDQMIRQNVLRKGSSSALCHFPSCDVRYPLSAFKVDLLKHFGMHFSQLHPLAFMRIVHFELQCVAVAVEPSVVSPPCYYFMFTSTYPKEWKNRFIFVSSAMMSESSPLRDPKAPIEDSVPVLSVDEIVQWKRMYENPTRVFTFLFVQKPSLGKKMTLWGLLQGDCRDIKFMVGDKVDPDMSHALEKKVPGTGSSVHVFR